MMAEHYSLEDETITRYSPVWFRKLILGSHLVRVDVQYAENYAMSFKFHDDMGVGLPIADALDKTNRQLSRRTQFETLNDALHQGHLESVAQWDQVDVSALRREYVKFKLLPEVAVAEFKVYTEYPLPDDAKDAREELC
jgi:hypothetical protein